MCVYMHCSYVWISIYSLCVCVCLPYAKLFCYHLMTQTHAVSAAETGVCDICIFKIAYGVCLCVSLWRLICMHVCLLCLKIKACLCKSKHTWMCVYANAHSSVHTRICVSISRCSRQVVHLRQVSLLLNLQDYMQTGSQYSIFGTSP